MKFFEVIEFHPKPNLTHKIDANQMDYLSVDQNNKQKANLLNRQIKLLHQ